MGNMKARIKYEINPKELSKKAIEYRIDIYERTRYVNMLQELKLIEDILENAKDNAEITAKYKAKLDLLNEERKWFLDKTAENYNNEHEK